MVATRELGLDSTSTSEGEDGPHRRRFPRMSVIIPATVALEGSSQTFTGEILNLSRGGAFVHCIAPLRLGQRVRLEVRVETRVIDQTMNALVPQWTMIPLENCVVRWMRGSHQSGFGVEFQALSFSTLEWITKILSGEANV
jgi:PilZ domain